MNILSLFAGSLIFSASLSATVYTVIHGFENATTISMGGSGSGNNGDLRYVLNTILNDQAINMVPTERVIQFAPSVTLVMLEAPLPMINLFQGDTTLINVGSDPNRSVVIDGNGFRPFFVVQGNNVTLENLNILNGAAIGGSGGIGGGGSGSNLGGGGGGGGLGAGGAIFVDSATVTLNNISFLSNKSVGGSGGSVTGLGFGAGGGGGLGGNGGQALGNSGAGGGGYCGQGGFAMGDAGGGGGSFGNGGNSGATANSGGGGGGGAIIGADGGAGNGINGTSVLGFAFGGGGGGGSADNASNGGSGGGTNNGVGGTTNGGGGGGGYNGSAGANGSPGYGGQGGTGGGGGGASGSYNGKSGAGGPGGGGGGAGTHSIGNMGSYGGGGGGFGLGGFGGGGGGGSFGFGGFGGGGGGGDFGFGGFGGGGGGGFGLGFGGIGGVGAGVGSIFPGAGGDSGGGGGAGFGGAIFVNTGTILFQGPGMITESSVFPGASGTPNAKPGSIAGSDVFIMSGAGLIFAPGVGQVINLSGSIADDSSTSVPGGDGITPGTGLGGEVIKNGAGTLVLGGVSTYVGGTSLNDGVLSVEGKIIGSLLSKAGSILSGTGSVGDVTLEGTLSPGNNTIGTLTLSSIDFQAGSNFSVQLNPSQASLAEVTGVANISGPTTIIVREVLGMFHSNTTYKILEASVPVGGVNFLTVRSIDPDFQFIIDDSIPNEIRIILVSCMNFKGCRISNKFLNQTDFINILTWQASQSDVVTSYRIYRDPELTDFVAEIPANGPFTYLDHNREKHKTYTYYLETVYADGTQSLIIGILVPPDNHCSTKENLCENS